jgi:hypothetical protein
LAKKQHGNEKVKKDALDLRDIYYEPTLGELPTTLDNWKQVPRVLDQKSEGACVGFGAAAVVNYLLANRSEKGGKKPEPASPRMLYEMAKRYDEWEGEHYEGSSLRGAMKGWYHHGVCSEKEWPYDVKKAGRPTPQSALDAQWRPLGAYYRVRHRHLNHMHAALNETGILLASGAVHAGWDTSDRDGYIPFQHEPLGGHAFAIIGYDAEGFWIQNSWGESWGYWGFGHLRYDDWLQNGWDCWVARMGVPIETYREGGVSVATRARFDYVPYAEVDPSAILPHLVHLGDNGQLKKSGRFATDEQDVREIVHQSMDAMLQTFSKPKVMLYAHGGLNSGKASAARISSMRATFLANEIYPIHFMWETGLLESLLGAARHALSLGRTRGLGETFSNLIDEAIELGARPIGKPVWSEMKQNADLASGANGGAALLVKELATWLAADGNAFDLHLVGHSAGSIFHSFLIDQLVAAGIPIKSLTLFAPACTTKLFRDHVVHNSAHIGQTAVFNLTDEAERDDSVGPYRKSLLYFVSESFELERHEKILGMDKCLQKDNTIKSFLGLPTPQTAGSSTTVAYVAGAAAPAKLSSKSESHGGFDNDDDTLNSTLRLILGGAPQREF